MSQASYPVQTVLKSGQSIAASYTSDTVPKVNYFGFYIQLVVTAGTSPTGTFQVQSSADGLSWANVSNGSIAITDNGVYAYSTAAPTHYHYWRVVYTRTSGTGTLAITYNMS